MRSPFLKIRWPTVFARVEASWVVIVLCFGYSCATPVGVSRVGRQSAYRELNANILGTDHPSIYSTQEVERTALIRLYGEAPAAALAELRAGLGGPDEEDRLFALSELSFAVAENNRDPGYYFASAIYAYSFLYPANHRTAPSRYDPRVALALDLYDQGIAGGLADQHGEQLDLSSRQVKLPFGRLMLQNDQERSDYGGYPLSHFVSLSQFRVRGLRNRYRVAGIGAPLAATVEKTDQDKASGWIPSNAKVPVTAFVRFDDPQGGISNGIVHGTLELYDVDKMPAVKIGDYVVPLASEPTAALAYCLEGAPVWDFEIAGFRGSDLSSFGRPGEDTGLVMIHPYVPWTNTTGIRPGT